jgi:hypothetical protein
MILLFFGLLLHNTFASDDVQNKNLLAEQIQEEQIQAEQIQAEQIQAEQIRAHPPAKSNYSICCKLRTALSRHNNEDQCKLGRIVGPVEYMGWLNGHVQWLNRHVQNSVNCHNFVMYKGSFIYQSNYMFEPHARRTKNWMTTHWSTFNFDKKWVSNVIFPGTHDSLSYGKSNYISSAQGRTFEDQIYDGIRYFDLRFRVSENDYQAVHGSVSFPVYLFKNKQIKVESIEDTMTNVGLSVRNAIRSFVTTNKNISKEIFMIEWRLDGIEDIDPENFWASVVSCFDDFRELIFTRKDLIKTTRNTTNLSAKLASTSMEKIVNRINSRRIKTKFSDGPIFINFAHNYKTIPKKYKYYFFSYYNMIYNTYPQFFSFSNNDANIMLKKYVDPYYTGNVFEKSPMLNVLSITQSSNVVFTSLFKTATKITSVITDFLLYKGPFGRSDKNPENYKNAFDPCNDYSSIYNYNIITTNYYEISPFIENLLLLNKYNPAIDRMT